MDTLSTIATIVSSTLAGAGAAVRFSYSVFDKAMDRKFFLFQQELMDKLEGTFLRSREAELRFSAMHATMDQLLDGMRIINEKLMIREIK